MNATLTPPSPAATTVAISASTPTLPETAPFTPAQRSWLNGYFAGLLSTSHNPDSNTAGISSSQSAIRNPQFAIVEEESFPWHDPALGLAERLELAADKPIERKLMAAMAQLDCGACGYLCQSYSEAIAEGREKNLTLCMPGGKETASKLKEFVQLGIKPSAKSASPSTGTQTDTSKPVYNRSNPFPARFVNAKPLNGVGSDKDTRHIVFDLKGSGLTYKPGDALGVWPENCPDLAHEILEALSASGAEDVASPDGQTISLWDALLQHFVITQPTDELAQLLGVEPLEGASVIDLLRKSPAQRRPAPADFVAALSPMNPRLYSISSSLRANPDQVHLTIGVVTYKNGLGTSCKGVCSTFLAHRVRPGQKVRIFFHASPKFGLPANHETPIIMVGPGTGIAPFRAFLQERAATAAKGGNWLFFGDQRGSTDFLYEQELSNWQRDGVLTKLHTAFSRDQSQKVYVQHRMIEHQADLWRWLEQGAHFYVCGDAKRMATDVDNALKQVIKSQSGKNDAEVAEYIAEMAKAGRYQRDVY